MEVMDGECKDGARKEHCSRSKMVDELLEVSCWSCWRWWMVSARIVHKMVDELLEVSCWR